MRQYIGGLLVGIGVIVAVNPLTTSAALRPSDLSTIDTTIKTIQLPKVSQPAWLQKQLAAEKMAASKRRTTNTATMRITYDTAIRGNVSANFSEFKALANQTLNDTRGWARMNVEFVEVKSGGQFSLLLAEASQVATFGGCSSQYSCRSGRYVLINQDRWQGATPSWNSSGGSLRDYRHMVVNHEVGHWLGHDHAFCGGNGQAAPVMQQQSISLQGCSFNPWPLHSELWSTALGIAR